MTRTRRYAGLTILLCLMATAVQAQLTGGTISGSVRDASGAVMPNTKVEIRNQDTGITRTLTTDDRGRYQATNLSLGDYTLVAQLAGFRAAVRSGITLTVGQEAAVDFTLEVGEVTERVEVVGEAPMIEIASSSVGGLVEGKQIRDLPLNGRSFEELATLQPGVTLARTASTTFFSGNTPKINVAGARTTSTGFLLDGADIKDVWGTTPGSAAGVSMGVDNVREFKVLVNNFSAEYPNAAGGVVTAITRSGTNTIHGTAFEFLRNSAFDARNFFDTRIRPFRRNQFGGTMGGPIRRDKAFYFGSFEGLKDRTTLTSIVNVPNNNTRAGRTPSGGSVNPAILPYLLLLPVANGKDNGDGTAEFSGPARNITNEENVMFRYDHTLSSNDSFFARYTFDNANLDNPSVHGTLKTNDRSRNQYLTMEESKILSATLLNSARLSYNRSVGEEICFREKDIPATLDLIPGVPFGSSGGLTGAGITGLAACGTGPRQNYYNLYEFADNMSLTHGGHTLKAGMLVKNVRFNVTAWATRAGQYAFSSVPNFLAGVANTFLATFPDTSATRSWRQTLYGFYLQDDYQIRRGLTLNTGLRYEFVTGPREVFGRSARLLDPLDRQTTVLGKQALYNTDRALFSPRFGFAWDPQGNGKTSLRGGIGMFFDQLLPWYYGSVQGLRIPPFFDRGQINAPPFPNAYTLLDPRNSLRQMENVGPTHTPTTYQYNLTLQRELLPDLMLMVGYIGSRGIYLVESGDYNAAIPVIQPDGRKFFPVGSTNRNPNFSENTVSMTGGDSRYNGLLISANKRFGMGLQFQINYTLSNNIDDNSQQFAPEANNNPRRLMDPEDSNRDKGPSAYDVRNNLLTNFSYDLPFGPGKPLGGNLGGVAGRIIGGWQVNGILSLVSGSPITVSLGFNRSRSAQTPTGSGFHERPDLVAGKSNNPVTGNRKDIDHWIAPSSFSLPDAGYYGNLGRNTVSGPGVANMDFSLFKNTSLGEQRNLQFRAEFFNILNRANFGTPAAQIYNNATVNAAGVVPPLPTFGRIRTARPGRIIQFALKLTF